MNNDVIDTPDVVDSSNISDTSDDSSDLSHVVAASSLMNTFVTLNEIIESETEDYLSTIRPDDAFVSPRQIENELLYNISHRICCENQSRPKTTKLKIPQKLFPVQISMILLHLYHIVNINCSGSKDEESLLLAMYQEYGEDAGLYVWNELKIRKLIRNYNLQITKKEIEETIDCLKCNAPLVRRTTDKNLIPVNNGIFNFETKILEPFSHEYVFLSKSRVKYNPAATNVIIHNDTDGTDWDVESWVADLFDDKELEELIWEVLSAVVRPFVRWKKVVWLYSDEGNNGKGTLCELARSLVGDGSYASIPVVRFSQKFALEPLLRATAIITDENSFSFIDISDDFKAIATNDTVSIERKYKSPVDYQFYGLQIQCTNALIRFKDKTDSLYRRMLMIPFEKCFTGIERPYIKEDYLHRPEVLEYVLYKVLNMNFYKFSEPMACKKLLNDYKIDNDPMRQFWEDVREELVWDIVPFCFLYDLYCGWMHKYVPHGKIQSRQSFKKDFTSILRKDDIWCMGDKKVRVKRYLSKPEPLILEYSLDDWKNRTYMGGDIDKVCSTSYDGVVLCVHRIGVEIDDEEDT